MKSLLSWLVSTSILCVRLRYHCPRNFSFPCKIFLSSSHRDNIECEEKIRCTLKALLSWLVSRLEMVVFSHGGKLLEDLKEERDKRSLCVGFTVEGNRKGDWTRFDSSAYCVTHLFKRRVSKAEENYLEKRTYRLRYAIFLCVVFQWKYWLLFCFFQEENIRPVKLAIDRPSEKFLAFLDKYYGLSKIIPQNNKFVVFQGFFDDGTYLFSFLFFLL